MSICDKLYEEIRKIPIVDIHTHVDFKNPFAKNAWYLLSYHYFTEMAHSQGMRREIVTSGKYSDEERVKEIFKYFPGMVATEPYRWLLSLSRRLFNFPDSHLEPDNWKDYWECVENKSTHSDRLKEICNISEIESIALTNLPWESLDGVEKYTNRDGAQLFIPTFRVDPLLSGDKSSIERLQESTGIEISNLRSFEDAIVGRLSYFKEKGARSLAFSVKPDPVMVEVKRGEAERIFDRVMREGRLYGRDDLVKFRSHILEFLCTLCQSYNIAFQWMVGVEKDVYLHGVPGGMDILHPMGALKGISFLLNKYPKVRFPISVLSFVEDKELATYARIFPNVYASGHWWFENTYESIKSNLKNRLKLAPHTKLIGQYSDSYTTEFIEAKMDMYRKALSDVLAELIEEGRIEEKHALDIANSLLYNVPKEVFNLP